MKTFLLTCFMAIAVLTFTSMKESEAPAEGWVSIFDGKSFNNWKMSEHPETFTIKDGAIVVFGERAHLFYDGAVKVYLCIYRQVIGYFLNGEQLYPWSRNCPDLQDKFPLPIIFFHKTKLHRWYVLCS